MGNNKSTIINFAPNGMIPVKNSTPYVPIIPSEIIEQTHEAFELGITVVHLHARDDDGTPTYKSSVYRDIFEGVKKHCPGLVISASLSGRDFQEIEKRTEVLSLKPDMGSLTLSSLNFVQQASINSPSTILSLIEAMKQNGVKPELECFDVGMINYSKYLIRKGLLHPPFYYNILCGNIASSQADISYTGLMIRDLPEESYWALAGIGRDQLTMNTLSIAIGGGVRVGIEDNIWYDSNQKKLAKNIDLIKRIHRIANELERDIMSPEEFGNFGFYNENKS
jgi:3-keto-5-aminohexanoate cleavage enzyme